MSWIEEHKDELRLALLVLALLAFLGPWTFDNDGVPPPEWCTPSRGAPHLVLLESGHCARLVRGLEVMTYTPRLIFGFGYSLVSGNEPPAGLWRGLLILGMLLALLAPLVAGLWLLRGGDNRRRQAVYLLAWALALTVLLVPFFPSGGLAPGVLWGLWLYRLLALAAIGLEILLLAAGRWARLPIRDPAP